VVEVSLWSPRDEVWERVKMVVDTGADYTLLPRYMALLLGVDLQRAKRITSQGTAGEHEVFFVHGIRGRVGSMQREFPVGFLDSNLVPPLMGRHKFLETFRVELEGTEQITFSE
jgi:predicted aspartyl protease